MNELKLTEDEMKEMIAIKIKQHWPKMVADSKRVSSYNYEKYGEDLLAFCLSDLISKKPLPYQFQLIVQDDKLCNYIGKSMSLNIRSNTSPFWARYRKEGYSYRGTYLVEQGDTIQPDQLTYIDENFDLPEHQVDPMSCVLKALDNLDFYHKALVTDYYIKQMTYKQLHEKYGITLISLKKDVQKGLKLIKQQCNQFKP